VEAAEDASAAGEGAPSAVAASTALPGGVCPAAVALAGVRGVIAADSALALVPAPALLPAAPSASGDRTEAATPAGLAGLVHLPGERRCCKRRGGVA